MSPRVGGIIVILFGVVFLIVSYLGFRQSLHLQQVGLKTNGSVIDYQQQTSSQSGGTTYTYYPVIRFTDKNGQPQQFTSASGSSSKKYFIGANVQILYDPNKPSDAEINGPAASPLMPIGAAGISFILIILGIILVIRGSKSSPVVGAAEETMVMNNPGQVSQNSSGIGEETKIYPPTDFTAPQ